MLTSIRNVKFYKKCVGIQCLSPLFVLFSLIKLADLFPHRIALSAIGCVFTTTAASLHIPEGVLIGDFVKRLKNDTCFHG